MKNEKNPGARPNVNTGKETGSEKSPSKNNTAETKTKGGEVWKNPDPTTPERKNNPDPTKPEKQEGPYSSDSKQKKAGTDKGNIPAGSEKKDDQEIGSLEEQDIDDQGITGEANDDDDFSEDDRKSA